ncbi:MAG: outer membrane protein assembly factor BamE [Magnetococcales bacterium]|nr:outer membrane protein assembly factor BamE [Magnetococcales bacterium]
MIRSNPFHPWRTILAIMAALMLAACQAVVHEKGSIIKPELVEQIVVDVTTHDEVLELLGPPTHINPFQSTRWLYIQDRSYKDLQVVYARAFNTLELEFDSGGVVRHISRNFEDELIDPTNLPEAMKDPSVWKRIWGDDDIGLADAAKKPGFWKRLWGADRKELDAAEAAQTTQTPLNEKDDIAWWKVWKKDRWKFWRDNREVQGISEADSVEGMDSKEDLGYMQRFVNTFKNKPKRKPPEINFTPEDRDWWKGMFEEDPTKRKTAPVPTHNTEPGKSDDEQWKVW